MKNLRPLRSLAVAIVVLFGLIPPAFAAEVREPKPGSPERTAIMEAMRIPISRHIGKRVTFTGSVRVSEGWAIFTGGAAPTDGKAPANEEVQGELELDLFVVLRLEEGKWRVLQWNFAGDIGPSIEARQKYPKIPKALLPPVAE